MPLPRSREPRAQPHPNYNVGHQDMLTESSSIRPSLPSRQNTPPIRSLVPPQRSPISPSFRSNSASALYASPGVAESTELLLPPSRHTKPYRFRDEQSPARSPNNSAFSSRRTSWSSDTGSRDSRMGPFSPFEDTTRSPSASGADDDTNINTQTVSEKFNILPYAGLLLFPEDVEKDDWLHNPDSNDKDMHDCNVFTKRGMMNIGGLIFLTIGLLTMFIGFPVLTFVKKVVYPPDPCAANPLCIDLGPIPLLKNIRTSLIDPDTPQSALTKVSADGTTLKLVFSDEFNKDGRTFYPDDDPYFEAVDLWYGVTQDLEWYDPDAVTTKDGVLELKFDAFQNHGLNYRSGMVQSWNKMCFKGGWMEASISLPGKGDVGGFWPGFWAMGNLGRPGYASTTDGLWPYSYHDVCDVGITKNQSSPDGLSFLPGMRLPACTCSGEDHPSPGKSRSAPEIDAIEASTGPIGPGNSHYVGSASQSAQIAPFDIWYAPDYDFLEVYDPSVTSMNAYRGGAFQQAISGVSILNNNWYDGKEYQKYGFQYTPGDNGNVVWNIGDTYTWKLDARALGPNGNVGQRTIPQEPMSLVMNFGMSDSFAQVNLPALSALMPAKMRFDYVRIYQDPANQMVSCDPPGYETTDYIASHPEAYTNPNKTSWAQTNHAWPKNSFVDGCSA